MVKILWSNAFFSKYQAEEETKLGVSLYAELYYAPFYKSLLLKVAATDLSTQFFLWLP